MAPVVTRPPPPSFFRVKRKAKTLESIHRGVDGALSPGHNSPLDQSGNDLRIPLLGSEAASGAGVVSQEKAGEGDGQWAYDQAFRGRTTPLSISTPHESQRASPTNSDRPVVGSFGAEARSGPSLAPRRTGKPPRANRTRRRSKRNLDRQSQSWGHGAMTSAARTDAAGGEAAHQPSLGVLWSQLTWADKLRIFRFWCAAFTPPPSFPRLRAWPCCPRQGLLAEAVLPPHRTRPRFFIFTAGNLITVVASIADLSAPEPVDPTSRLLSGLGCALLWVGVLGYLEHDKRFYTLILTLRRGLPPIARFMVRWRQSPRGARPARPSV